MSTVVNAVFGWIGEVATTITSSPLLLIPLALTLIGAAIGLAMKLMGTRKGKKR